jgi:capsular exopolysaccharide synthesis family protein
MEESLQKVVPSRGDLRLLSAGPKPPNPSEILAGTKVREIIEELKQMADIVLIDTPPVLPVTDAAVLSRNVDASLVVGRASFVTKKQIKRTLEMLRQVDAPLIGVVLNGIAPEVGYGSAYSYTYGYGYYDTGSGTENTETRKSARKKKSKAKV